MYYEARIVSDQVIAGLSERAVVYKAKESDIFSGREMSRLEYLPTGYPTAIICQSRGRKATKKCVEQVTDRVLILYSKATIWKLAKPYAFDGTPEYIETLHICLQFTAISACA